MTLSFLTWILSRLSEAVDKACARLDVCSWESGLVGALECLWVEARPATRGDGRRWGGGRELWCSQSKNSTASIFLLPCSLPTTIPSWFPLSSPHFSQNRKGFSWKKERFRVVPRSSRLHLEQGSSEWWDIHTLQMSSHVSLHPISDCTPLLLNYATKCLIMMHWDR